MVYNILFISSIGITSFPSTKYKIQKKDNVGFHQVLCGLQLPLTLFSKPITVFRPISLIKRLHLPLTSHNISKVSYRSECSNVHILLAPRCHEGTEHAANFTRVASRGYELLITLTGHKISTSLQHPDRKQCCKFTQYDMIY
jgi:hypothetical protein